MSSFVPFTIRDSRSAVPLSRSRALRCAAILSLGLVLAGLARVPALQEIGAFLVTEDFRYEEAFLNQRIFLIKPWF